MAGLIGCRSTPSGEFIHYSSKTLPLEDPPLVTLEVNTGEIIISSWPVQNIRAIYIDSEITGTSNLKRKAPVVSTTLKNSELSSTIKKGNAYLSISESDYDYYTSVHPVSISYGENKGSGKGGIAIPKKGGDLKAFVVPLSFDVAQTLITNDDIKYTEIGSIANPVEYKGYGQTITYLGMSQGQIKFVYKEFNE